VKTPEKSIIRQASKIDLREDFPMIQNRDISNDDIYDAMKNMEGFIDISIKDFKELYQLAYRHATERILHTVKGGDLMTTNVLSVKANASLQEIIAIMASKSISGLPVVDIQGKVLGVISEKDLLRYLGGRPVSSFWEIVAHCFRNGNCMTLKAPDITAADIMSRSPVTVHTTTSALDIAHIFRKHAINRVPVVDHNDHLVGIVTRNDLLQAHLPEIEEE
jgi:CBS domain-containing protein